MNVSSSTTSHWLTNSTSLLEQAGIATARLDCLVLLEDITGKDRSWLLAHPEYNLSSEQLVLLDKSLERRASHEPLSYIRGRSEFYGREFIVSSNTLEPRPESETIIEQVKKIVKSRENIVITDIGTGSGCLAISVKLEIPNATVLASDIDVKCIETARENSKKLKADVKYYEGNLLEPLSNNNHKITIIMANLPYVPDSYKLNEAARFEPKKAIFGGKDGLDLYREMFGQISALKQKPSYVVTESLPFQHELLASIAKLCGYKLTDTDDFIQVFSLSEPLPA